MIPGIDPNCLKEVRGGLIVDCIPPAERRKYRLWRASAFAPLVRNAANGSFVLNVGAPGRERNEIFFGRSWQRAFDGAAQIILDDPPRRDLQDVAGAHIELASKGIVVDEGPIVVVFSLDPTLDPIRTYGLNPIDGVHRVTEQDVPMSALDPYTYRSLAGALGHIGIEMPS